MSVVGVVACTCGEAKFEIPPPREKLFILPLTCPVCGTIWWLRRYPNGEWDIQVRKRKSAKRERGWCTPTLDKEEPLPIVATTLPDAWFKAIDALLKVGRLWKIGKGSYEGQWRLEFDRFDARIKYPGARPLVPEIKEHIPPPADMDYVENEYLPYLMTSQPLKEGEQYTYGSRIEPQMEKIIKRYKSNGYGSNQECISVSRPEDIDLDDPPCLRQIDTRIYPPEALRLGEEVVALHFHVVFRSWALWGGFPLNLAAIRLMQEYMAHSIGVEAGEIYASSKGLHLYDHEWSVAAEVVHVPLPRRLAKLLKEKDNG